MTEPLSNQSQFLFYQTENGDIKIDVRFDNETVWLTINQMAELFGIDKSGISRHIKNIFQTGELLEPATVAKIATVQSEGGREVSRELDHYNLDMIISVVSGQKSYCHPFSNLGDSAIEGICD